jgi:hypothetical protein
MKTLLDTNLWSSDLYEGNAAFVQRASDGVIFVVSQVRPATNDFVVLRSNVVPPDPGPGWSFTQVASYAFPEPNISFDPVVSYDTGTGILHIIGTRNNPPVDILKFSFDTSTSVLSGPTVLATVSVVRDGYDVCPIGSGYTFIAASVTNPLTVDQIDTTVLVTGISISSNVLTVETAYGSPPAGNFFPPGIQVTFSGIQLATFLNGVTVQVASSDFFHFTASYSHPDYSQAFSPPMYESGFATWLPGHTLLGFMLDASDVIATPPWALASSPYRSGPVFGSTSACLSSGGDIEVYYESHPKNTLFQDQTFSVIELVGTPTLSPPDVAWGDPTTLTAFTGRYTDNRLTIIPDGDDRAACLVYYVQPPQTSSIVGNILLGYYSPSSSPPTWNWAMATGQVLDGSILQAAVSLSQTMGASVSYVLSPAYNKRGAWAYANLAANPAWQPSYSVNDWVLYTTASPPSEEDFLCANPMANRGWWASTGLYNLGDIASVPTYYQALDDIVGSPENLPPPDDTGNWQSATTPVPVTQQWNPSAPYMEGATVVVPAYYRFIGTAATGTVPPPLDSANWEILLPPPLDSANWTVVPAAWPFYSGELDLNTLSISNFYNYASLGLTWLRGTKSVLDDKTLWAVVGEASTGEAGSPPLEDVPYYVSHFNVPPTVQLSPISGTVLRGTPFLLDASGTYDPDTGDTIAYTWSLIVPSSPPDSPYVHLTPLLPPDEADLLADRAIGGAEVPVSVSVVAVDSTGANVNHPPMDVSSVAYSHGTNTASLVVNSIATVSMGQKVLAYGLANATFLNNAVLTVTGTLPSPPTIEGTVSFAINGIQPSSNYGPAADTGYAIIPPQYQVVQSDASSPPVGFIIPFDAAPTITMPSIPTAARNSVVTVAPVITPIPPNADSVMTYTWTQIAGDVMAAYGMDTPVLTFYTNGADIDGEDVTWNLEVDDGVNPAVSAQITIWVDSYFTVSPPVPIDTLNFSRAVWWGNIAERNASASPPAWGPLDSSGIFTDFFGVKRTNVLQGNSPPFVGNDRYIVISPYSVLVYVGDESGSSPPMYLLRKLYLPAPSMALPPLVSDAVHTEDDYTLVLGNDNNLYRYDAAPLIETDNPDIILDLSDYSSLAFTKVFSTVSFAGERVLALSGPDGCLLAQVDNDTLVPQAVLEISMTSQLLYGADNVQFVRLSDVENTRSGQVFIGTVDASGNTYETLVDLSSGSIIGTWNKTQLVNQIVASGEVLFQPYSPYSGKPLAPTLGTPVDKGAAIQPGYELVALSWIQDRPDLASGYVIFGSANGGSTWFIASTVGSGSIETVTLTIAKGHTYLFRMYTASDDGDSGYSNEESISV